MQQDGSLSATALGIGGKDESTNGGTGEVDILSGGNATISGETRLWTSASRLAIFGDGTMTTGTFTNPDGTSPTVQLSDPPGGGPALTVGTSDPVASTTFSGTIEDINPGSLKKTGSNRFVLSGNNTYSGGTILDGGTLVLGHNNAAGSGTITVEGSTIEYVNGLSIANPIDLQNNVSLSVPSGSADAVGHHQRVEW